MTTKLKHSRDTIGLPSPVSDAYVGAENVLARRPITDVILVSFALEGASCQGVNERSLSLLLAVQLSDSDVPKLHERGAPFAVFPLGMMLQSDGTTAWNAG